MSYYNEFLSYFIINVIKSPKQRERRSLQQYRPVLTVLYIHRFLKVPFPLSRLVFADIASRYLSSQRICIEIVLCPWIVSSSHDTFKMQRVKVWNRATTNWCNRLSRITIKPFICSIYCYNRPVLVLMVWKECRTHHYLCFVLFNNLLVFIDIIVVRLVNYFQIIIQIFNIVDLYFIDSIRRCNINNFVFHGINIPYGITMFQYRFSSSLWTRDPEYTKNHFR